MLHYTSLRAVPYMTGISLLWLPHVSVSLGPCCVGPAHHAYAKPQARPDLRSCRTVPRAIGPRAFMNVHMYSYKLTIFKPLIYPVDPLI